MNADVRNYSNLKKIIVKEKPEIIFHLAAQPIISKSYDNPRYTYEVNSLGTLNIIDIIKSVKTVKSAVFVTSDKCYESNNSTIGFKENDKLGGVDPYSGSKASAEIIVNTYYHSFYTQFIYRKRKSRSISISNNYDNIFLCKPLEKKRLAVNCRHKFIGDFFALL